MEELVEVIAKLHDDNCTQKQRGNLHEDLRRLIRTITPTVVTEKHVQSLVGQLLSNIKLERALYLNAKIAGQAAIGSRLSNYGQCLLHLFNVSLDQLKFRTIKLFIYHCLDILPVIRDILLNPLATIYLRILHKILASEAHRDHFDQELWRQITNFCINSIECFEHLGDSYGSDDEADMSQVWQEPKRRPLKNETLALLACLASLLDWKGARLTSGPSEQNDALVPRLINLLDVIIKRHVTESKASGHCLSISRNLLHYVAANDLSSALRLTTLVVYLANKLWITRLESLKDELIRCLLLGAKFFKLLAVTSDVKEELHVLARTLAHDLLTRSHNVSLALSDLALFSQATTASAQSMATQTKNSFSIHSYDTSKQAVYFVTKILAILHSALRGTEKAQIRTEGVVKRQKLTMECEHVDIVDFLHNKNERHSLLGIQLISLIFEQGSAHDDFTEELNSVLQFVSSESLQLQMWAHICLASAMFNNINSNFFVNESNQAYLWRHALRGTESSIISRSACHLANVILDLCKLPSSLFGQTASSIALDIVNRGPAIVSDASVSFVLRLLSESRRHNLIGAIAPTELALAWICERSLSTIWLDAAQKTSSVYTIFSSVTMSMIGIPLSCTTTTGPFEDIEYALQADREAHALLLDHYLPGPDLFRDTTDGDSCSLKSETGFNAQTRSILSKRIHRLLTSVSDDEFIATDHFIEAFSTILTYFNCSGVQLVVNEAEEETVHALCVVLNEKMAQINLDISFFPRLLRTTVAPISAILARSHDSSATTALQSFLKLLSNFKDMIKLLKQEQLNFENSLQDDQKFEQSTSTISQSQKCHFDGDISAPSVADTSCLMVLLLDHFSSATSSSTTFKSFFLQEDPAWLLRCTVLWYLWDVLPGSIAAIYQNDILEYLTLNVLHEYKFERSENTLNFVITFLTLTTHSWASVSSTSASTARKIYEWTVKIAVTARVASPAIRRNVLKLSRLLLKYDSNTENGDKSLQNPTSVRTMLVMQLNDDDLRVALAAANATLSIFDAYDISTYDHIYNDITGALSSSYFDETRARLRLYCLSLLATKSEVIRSTAIYHIIEMSTITKLHPFIEQMLRRIALHWKISVTALLSTHSYDIFYNWLTSVTIFSFPYQLFGYSNIEEFLGQYKWEIVAQMTVLRHNDDLIRMTKTLDINLDVLLTKSAIRIIVYSRLLGITLSQDLYGNEVLLEAINKNIVPRLADQQSILVLSFSLIHDAVDFPKSLLKAGMVSAARRATFLRSLISETLRAPSREPLQTTTKMFLSLFQTAEYHLTTSSIVKCIRGLLNVLQDGMILQKWQALRKLTMFLAILDTTLLPLYASEMLFTGLSAILNSEIGAFRFAITRMLIYLMQNTDNLSLQDSATAFATFLSVLRAVQNISVESEKSTLVEEIRLFLSRQKDKSFLNIANLLQTHQTQNFDSECQKLALINHTSQLFADTTTESANHAISALVTVLSSCDESATRASAKLICTSQLTVLSELHFSDATQVQFVNRVIGQSFLMYGQKEWHGRDYPLQEFLRTDPEYIIQTILNCLRASQSTSVEVAERTLARCIKVNKEQLSPFMSADLLQTFSTYETDPCLVVQIKAQLSQVILADYASWLRNVSEFLLDYLRNDTFLISLKEIMEVDEHFASSNLSLLMMCAINRSIMLKDATDQQLSQLFQTVFKNHTSLTREHVLTCISSCHRARHAACLHNEQLRGPKSGLIVNYLLVAEAAAHHNLLFDATLFLHMYSLYGEQLSRTSSVKRIQASIYERIPEPDSYYGVITEPSLDSALARTRYEHGDWKGLPFYAAIQSAERRLGCSQSDELSRYVSSSFCEMRYDSFNLGNIYDGNTSEACYESAWRLEEWHLPFNSATSGPQQVLYRTLCALSTTSWASSADMHSLIRQAHAEFSQCSQKNTDRWTLMLATLTELEEIISVRHDPVQNISDFLHTVWQARSNQLHEILEPREYETLIAARQVYLSIVRRQDETNHGLITAQLDLLVTDYDRCTDDNGQQQALLNATQFATRLVSVTGYICPLELRLRVDSLVANVLWQIGDTNTSISLSHNLQNRIQMSGHVAPLITAANLLNIGLRASDGRLEKASDIINKYLLPAIGLLGAEECSAAGTLHSRFAAFCHVQFMSHDQNKDHQRLETLRNEKKQEILALESLKTSSTTSDERRRLEARTEKARALFEVDDAEYREINLTRQVYLRESLSSFLKAFALVDSADTLISRCCALWFANSTNNGANEAFQTNIANVPSYKFLILLNQLLARLSTAPDLFQSNLATLLSRMALEHPYHSLYSMYAVQYSKRSGDIPAKDRAKALTRIMQDLMVDETLGNIVTKVHYLCSNYVKLASFVVNKSDFPEKDIPFTSIANHRAFLTQIPKMKLPPLTFNIEPRLSKDYTDIPTIASYERSFRLASGISVPKILQLRISDGNICKELVKGGNDDLRQDVVMQQVFVQVDELFKRNRETVRRQLNIRTYKVLPLTTNAGVLEWVLDTKPMQEVLQPLHVKYNPDDWNYGACRKAIAEVSKRSRQTRIEAYKKVTQNCRPAMRHAFLEMFADAYEWYHAQLAYTRSTAAISIVGHVLGLGDRHLHNIILDTKTGEVVHIDLGIAFEQGRTLPIPERVPFRLTRDVVDGMGILGVEGVFRRCCEFTLEMMRKEQAGITSILDVLRYDPLYSWTLSPLRKHRAQERPNDQVTGQSRTEGNGGPEVGTEAARALLVVEQKLSATLSASAVVNELIQEATDVENLALIFAGWSAWY